jgi:leucyl aminopeptidase
MNLKPSTNNPSIVDLRIIPILEDNFNEMMLEKLPDLTLSTAIFSGKNDTTYLFQQEDTLIFLIGLGKSPAYESIEKSFRRILSKQADLITHAVKIDFAQAFIANQVEAALVGFQLGGYSVDFFKRAADKKKDFSKLSCEVSSGIENIELTVNRAQEIAKAKIEAFRLVDLPPNVLTPSYLADWATKLAQSLDLNVRIFDSEKAKEEGLDAFLAVGRGSAKEPKFIILNYTHPEAKFHLGLVGKGVTFDTGGLNVKTQGMVHMKSDMGGAATVLAATQLIAALKLPITLTTIVPTVENAIDKDAYLPSEVIQSHAGLSIEVIDTDAEGRLILADGLSYLVKNYNPDQIIDFATLTGSSVATFGYECGALFSNSEKLSLQLQTAGMESGEKVWPLPMWESYRKEMDSEIADIKNYHGKPIAGAITAAKFLEAFIHAHPNWAHLDIAGVAYDDSEFSKTKTGTAFGVQLLLKFIENQL